MREISVQELQKHLLKADSSKTLLIDVRTPGEFRGASIIGAKNITNTEINQHLDELKKYETVFVHCASGGRSSSCCLKLESQGLNNVVNVKGGINEWKSAGFAILDGKGSIPVIRQVHIIASTLILLSVILAKTIHPDFVYLAGIVSLGLGASGVFNTCLMANVLEKMPWNR